MIVSQSQYTVAAVSVASCLLLMVLPSSMSSAYRLERVRNDPVSYKGADLGRVESHREWDRNLPLLVSLLRHFYDWEQESFDVDESIRRRPDSSSQTLRSRQKQALLKMIASLSDLSHSIEDVHPEKVILDDKINHLPSTQSDEEDDDDDNADETLLTPKLKRGHVYGAMPPLNELCRMMGLNRCN